MKYIFSALVLLALIINSCKRDEIIITSATDYPKDIGYILLSKCAVTGCHNDASSEAADDLNLSSWDKLFKGSHSGSTVIPYRPDFSSLMYFVNTYPDLGLSNSPTMPLHGNKLTHEQVTRLRDWIKNGAPDKNGKVKFSDNPARKKFYITNQGCKVVCVVDAASLLPMRFVDVVDAGENAVPHQVKVSPDGQYFYVCFINGSYIKRYRTGDNAFDAKIFVGTASWNTMAFTPDSKYLFAVDWPGGKTVKCDLNLLKVKDSTTLADAPHGSLVAPDGKHVYFTATGGNYIYKIHVDSLSFPLDYYNFVAFNTMVGPGPSTKYNPHEIIFSPDSTKYYVTCSGNNNVGDLCVKVFDAVTDNLITSISLQSGGYEMSISKNKNYLFVSSYDGIFSGYQGRVSVINMATNTVIKDIATGTQPHGIAVDDAAGLVYVSNRNTAGTVTHHTSVCAGSNGSLIFIDLNTLQITGNRIELSVDPYSIGIKF